MLFYQIIVSPYFSSSPQKRHVPEDCNSNTTRISFNSHRSKLVFYFVKIALLSLGNNVYKNFPITSNVGENPLQIFSNYVVKKNIPNISHSVTYFL
jgi:hypothetical protein